LKNATVITLAEGQRLTGMDIRLAPSPPSVTLTGVVVRRDGTPAANASVELFDAASPGQRLFGMDAKTDAFGRFSVKAYQGREYLIRAYLPENYLAGTGVQSDRIRVRMRDSTSDLRIVLDRQGVF
jgi:hypothetical protein